MVNTYIKGLKCMAVSLKGRHFLKLQDFTKEELIQILDAADFIKMRTKLGTIIVTGKQIGRAHV